MLKKLLIVVLLAAVLRIPGIVLPSLTGDEISTVYQAQVEFKTMMNRLAFVEIPGADIAPPLYYIILHTLLVFFPSVMWTGRILSLIFDLITIIAVFFLTRSQLSEKQSLYASFFIALSPFHIWYAAEIRMYALVATLSVLSTLILSKYCCDHRKLYLFLYWFFSSLGIYTQYYFGLLLIGHIFAGFFLLNPKNFRHLLLVQVGIGLAFLPWLGAFLNDISVLKSNIPLQDTHSLFVPIYLVIKLVFFGNNYFVFDHLVLYGCVSLLLLVYAVLFIIKIKRMPNLVLMLFITTLCALVLISIVTLVTHQVFRPHATIVFLPLVMIVLATWFTSFGNQGIQQIVRCCIIIFWGFVIINYNLNPLYGKARIKESVTFLKEINQNKTMVLNPPLRIPCPQIVVPGSFRVIEYYAEDNFPVEFLPGMNTNEQLEIMRKKLVYQNDFYLIYYEYLHPPSFLKRLIKEIEIDYYHVFTTRFTSRVDTFTISITYYRSKSYPLTPNS